MLWLRKIELLRKKRTVKLLVDASLIKDNISATLAMMRVKIRAITLAFTTTWLISKITD